MHSTRMKKYMDNIYTHVQCYGTTTYKGVWRREVGYEKGAYKFEASISSGDLHNLYLGVIDRLEIDVRNFSDNRFGIALPYDSLPEKVEIPSNEYAMELGLPVVERGLKCRLEIINIITDQSVTIEGRLVKNAGQSFAFFTLKFFKLVIDLTQSENNVSGQFLLHKFESGKLTMQEMTRLLKVMHLGVRLENGKYPTLSLFFVQTTIH